MAKVLVWKYLNPRREVIASKRFFEKVTQLANIIIILIHRSSNETGSKYAQW